MDILEAPGRAPLPTVLPTTALPTTALPDSVLSESAVAVLPEREPPTAPAAAAALEENWAPCRRRRRLLLSWPAAIALVCGLLFVGGSIYLVVVLDSLAAHTASFTSQLTSIVDDLHPPAGASTGPLGG